MKKAILLSIIGILLFSNCSSDSDPEIEVCPAGPTSHFISFTVLNQHEVDLLNPESKLNILDDIKITYKDKDYTSIFNSGKVRDDISLPIGISLTKKENENYHLNFGEFDPEKKYNGETFTVTWKEENEMYYAIKDSISFNLYTIQENNETLIKKELSLNGKPYTYADEPFLINRFLFTEARFLDLFNPNILIEVTNRNGDNLLDSSIKGNLLDKITITYRSEKYKDIIPDSHSYPRFNMPLPLGIRIIKDKNGQNPLLAFGEFSPIGNYKGESLFIDWGDGTSDIIVFHLYITWEKEEPVVNHTIYLNGILYSKEKYYNRIGFWQTVKIIK